MELRKLWDGAIRFFHWSQLLLLAGLWWSAEQELYGIHMTLAYLLASLLFSRICWGLFGSENARFGHFLKSPIATWQWLRQRPLAKIAGHNPLSGYMVLTLILLLSVQFIAGLMTTDEVLTDGPLVALVPSSWVEIASTIHRFNLDLLLVLVAIHVLAALIHQYKGDRLIQPMLTGQQRAELLPVHSNIQFRPVWPFFLIFFCSVIGFYLWQGDTVLPMLLSDLR